MADTTVQHTWQEILSDWVTEPNQVRERSWSELALNELILEGLSTGLVLSILERRILTRDVLHDLVIPPRTLAHRRERGESLKSDEGDKLIRVLRIKAKALETFQNEEKANRWLRKPSRALRGQIPLEFLKTESGARIVEGELDKIAWGIFA